VEQSGNTVSSEEEITQLRLCPNRINSSRDLYLLHHAVFIEIEYEAPDGDSNAAPKVIMGGLKTHRVGGHSAESTAEENTGPQVRQRHADKVQAHGQIRRVAGRTIGLNEACLSISYGFEHGIQDERVLS
jgi:hypothetical protein